MPFRRALVVGQSAGARKLAQVLHCAEIDTRVVRELKLISSSRQNNEPILIFLPAAMLQAALTAPETREAAYLFVLTERVDAEIFARAHDSRVLGVVGLSKLGAAPRVWEAFGAARRLQARTPPNATTLLSFGHVWHEKRLRTTEDRKQATGEVENFCTLFQSRHQAAATAELADEMIMNAMYAAPRDESGRPRYAHRRREAIELDPRECPTLGYGCDGSRLVVSVSDPFGRLLRNDVFSGIHRGLATGQMDTRGGGSGLGMVLMHNTAKIVLFEVVPGRTTQVTGIIDLESRSQRVKQMPTSVYFFSY